MRNIIEKLVAEAKNTLCLYSPNKAAFHRNGTPAVLLVLDCSGSMDLDDYPPTRLKAAQRAALVFLDNYSRQSPEALAGVVFYAGSAIVACPLTALRGASSEFCRAIEQADTFGDTNISAGLNAAFREFAKCREAINPRIILLTDGHANEGPNPVETARELKAHGVQMDIIGIGGSPEDVDEVSLKSMASIINDELRYWFIEDSQKLLKKFEALALREF